MDPSTLSLGSPQHFTQGPLERPEPQVLELSLLGSSLTSPRNSCPKPSPPGGLSCAECEGWSLGLLSVGLGEEASEQTGSLLKTHFMAPPQTCRFITSQSGALTSWDCIHWTGSERIFGQVVFHLFPIRVTWPVVSDNLPGALPTEFSLRPVGASVWRVGSDPGDSKGRPGLRTWLLVHWVLRPGFSPSRGNKFCSAWALKGQVSAAHTPHVSRIWGTLYEERRVDNNNKLIDWSPRRSWLSWISPETKDRRGWRFPLFKVLLPVRVLGAGEGAVLTPLKV